MVKILGKPDKKVMTKMLVPIALRIKRILSSRCLKIMMLLITTASSNGYATIDYRHAGWGGAIEERAGLRVVVETRSPIKANLLLLNRL